MEKLEKLIKESERSHYIEGFALGLMVGVITMLVVYVFTM